jgi:hypothetical protein
MDFDNPCVWIDILDNVLDVPDYVETMPVEDPIYLRNLNKSITRCLKTGNVAVFHFEDFNTSVVNVTDIMYNKSLQKAVREAIKNIKELSITEEDNYNRKLFQISLDRITKILTKLCKKNKK